MMIEIEVAPAARSGKALGILDRHVGAVETPGEIAPPRRLRARTIGVLARQRELQLLEQDRPFGEFIRLLEYLVCRLLLEKIIILLNAGLPALSRCLHYPHCESAATLPRSTLRTSSARPDRRRRRTRAADGLASARCCSRATARGRPLRLRRS